MEKRLENRFHFFMGVVFPLILNFLFYFILQSILNLLTLEDQAYIIIYWVLYCFFSILALFLGELIFRYMTQEVKFSEDSLSLPEKNSRKEIPLNEQTKPKLEFFSAFRLDNFPKQVLTAILLVTIIYIPLDFVSYLLPNILEYQANSLTQSRLGAYFNFSFGQALFTALIVHFMVALREESFYRVYILTNGKDKLKNSTSFYYSAILFGLAHFSYIFAPSSEGYSPIFPVWWGLNALFIGIISAYVFITTRSIWPVFLSHWINNSISAMVTWNFIKGNPFMTAVLYLYLPIITIAIILAALNYKKIKNHFSNLLALMRVYFEELQEKKPINTNLHRKLQKQGVSLEDLNQVSTSDKIKYLLIDLGIILVLWLFAMVAF